MVDSEAQARNTVATRTPAQCDAVNHPSHYNHGGMETIDYIESLGIGFEFCVGNAIKYLSRAGYKDNIVQDLRKALWYIDRACRYMPTEATMLFLVKARDCVQRYVALEEAAAPLTAEYIIDISEHTGAPILVTDLLGEAVRCWKEGM